MSTSGKPLSYFINLAKVSPEELPYTDAAQINLQTHHGVDSLALFQRFLQEHGEVQLSARGLGAFMCAWHVFVALKAQKGSFVWRHTPSLRQLTVGLCGCSHLVHGDSGANPEERARGSGKTCASLPLPLSLSESQLVWCTVRGTTSWDRMHDAGVVTGLETTGGEGQGQHRQKAMMEIIFTQAPQLDELTALATPEPLHRQQRQGCCGAQRGGRQPEPTACGKEAAIATGQPSEAHSSRTKVCLRQHPAETTTWCDTSIILCG